ncbi:hypothetical protein NKH10_28725 [Mesorhizobium sp. M1340]|uniref:hypothetical protein n=1 Tax=Mesorhizobium sp. M1340 TaxID=2957087 RepID=UPI003335D7C8
MERGEGRDEDKGFDLGPGGMGGLPDFFDLYCGAWIDNGEISVMRKTIVRNVHGMTPTLNVIRRRNRVAHITNDIIAARIACLR